MKTRPVLLVGPRTAPGVAYGMSMGFELLVVGFERRNIPHIVLDRTQGMVGRKVGAFSLGGAVATLSLLMRFYSALFGSSTVYITVGTSKSGFIRDSLMIWPASLLGKRTVIHLKGGGFADFYDASPKWFKGLLRHTYARVDTIIVLGELLRNQYLFVPNIDQKLRVVPNGLPVEMQNDQVSVKEVSADQPIRLLYLSNMIPSKGYLDVLEACRILVYERQVPVLCDFCGAFLQTVNDLEDLSPIEAEQKFTSSIQQLELDDFVTYHGTVRGQQKQAILSQAHVFLLPTSYPWEGQPISIIEALAFAIPVISTRYRGIPEQVIDGYNGILVEPTMPEEIADAIERMWRNPEQYRMMSQGALNHYRSKFTQEAHLNRLIPIIIGGSETQSCNAASERVS